VPQAPPFNLDHYCHDGPMARTVGDCALFENVISGVWPGDIASLRERVEIPHDLPGIEGLRIALSVDLGDWDPNPDVRANTLRAAEALRAAGATVEEVDFRIDKAKLYEAAATHYASIFGPYVGGLIDEHREQMTSYAIDFGVVCGSVEPGAFLAGLEIEGEITARLGALLEAYDALICPTLTIAALPVDTPWSPDSPAAGIQDLPFDHLMTVPFNVASRCPVLNVPSGFSGDGAPTGLQLVGRTFDDVTPFRLGAALERAGVWDYATIRPALGV
jgi:aspartyl-tRNA(Asn)/glutamyl-tRNA(Gln) amidotransferase subunit A